MLALSELNNANHDASELQDKSLSQLYFKGGNRGMSVKKAARLEKSGEMVGGGEIELVMAAITKALKTMGRQWIQWLQCVIARYPLIACAVLQR